MKRTLLAGAAIALLACLPLAPTAFGDTGGDQHGVEDRAALFDARIAGLHAGLKLTGDQEKNWPTFENALRSVAKSRVERRRQMHAHDDDAERPSLIDRMHRMSDRLARRSTDIQLVADATAPLYTSLDDGQKRIFAVMFRDLRHAGGHRGRHRD